MARAVLALLLVLVAPVAASGQTPVGRGDVVAAAQARGARLMMARADSLTAEAQRKVARAWPNPTFSYSHSESFPQQHVNLDVPFDALWARGVRADVTNRSADAARARFRYERAGVRFEAESVYTTASAAEARARLSHRTALDAESLLVLARLRHDAGDASELDVEVAIVNAGQLENAAADDSIALIGALLDVQRVMGLPSNILQIALADSLAPPVDAPFPMPGVQSTLPLLAASASVEAARAAVKLEGRQVFEGPTFSVGVEHSDPGQRGYLPTFGISMALPLFDHRRGPSALASADLLRAETALEVTRRETDAGIAQATRQRAAALDRVRRDSRLLASAERVLQLSNVAYREGAAAMPSVLEAARSAREAVGRYIDDVAAALVADAQLRWITTTWETP